MSRPLQPTELKAQAAIAEESRAAATKRRPAFGSPSWTRTNDTAVNSRVLYRLSYGGMSEFWRDFKLVSPPDSLALSVFLVVQSL